jgi:hypothetical protein
MNVVMFVVVRLLCVELLINNSLLYWIIEVVHTYHMVFFL